jgi:hypothetical protein
VSEVWDNWKGAAKLGIYPFDHTAYEDHEQVITRLQSLDHEEWAKAYSAAAEPFEQAGIRAERDGDLTAARKHYLRASGLYRMGRWPACNSPGKKAAYEKSKAMFLAAARHFEVPVERVEMPFNGRAGEGRAVIGHFRKPKPGKLPILLAWGGLDYYKEDAADLFAPMLDKGQQHSQSIFQGPLTHRCWLHLTPSGCGTRLSFGSGRAPILMRAE